MIFLQIPFFPPQQRLEDFTSEVKQPTLLLFLTRRNVAHEGTAKIILQIHIMFVTIEAAELRCNLSFVVYGYRSAVTSYWSWLERNTWQLTSRLWSNGWCTLRLRIIFWTCTDESFLPEMLLIASLLRGDSVIHCSLSCRWYTFWLIRSWLLVLLSFVVVCTICDSCV